MARAKGPYGKYVKHKKNLIDWNDPEARRNYFRARRDLVPKNTRPSVEQRFWLKVKKSATSDCWIWIGGKCPAGYGRFFALGCLVPAHRFSYELHFGKSVPAQLDLDHLCRNKSCVNPNHLEPVTRKVNLERARCVNL